MAGWAVPIGMQRSVGRWLRLIRFRNGMRGAYGPARQAHGTGLQYLVMAVCRSPLQEKKDCQDQCEATLGHRALRPVSVSGIAAWFEWDLGVGHLTHPKDFQPSRRPQASGCHCGLHSLFIPGMSDAVGAAAPGPAILTCTVTGCACAKVKVSGKLWPCLRGCFSPISMTW